MAVATPCSHMTTFRTFGNLPSFMPVVTGLQFTRFFAKKTAYTSSFQQKCPNKQWVCLRTVTKVVKQGWLHVDLLCNHHDLISIMASCIMVLSWEPPVTHTLLWKAKLHNTFLLSEPPILLNQFNNLFHVKLIGCSHKLSTSFLIM